jgi:hypothetical protein
MHRWMKGCNLRIDIKEVSVSQHFPIIRIHYKAQEAFDLLHIPMSEDKISHKSHYMIYTVLISVLLV